MVATLSHDALAEEEQQKRQLYNRQEYVVGAEAQAKYGRTRVLVVGADGLGAEVVKNLVLTGVARVCVFDDAVVHARDLGSNFFLRPTDVGTRRSTAVARAASELNRFVEVRAVSGSGSGSADDDNDDAVVALLDDVDVVVYANRHTATLTRANAAARQRGVKFVSCESRGVACCVFVDAGDTLDVDDVDGEDTMTCVVTAIGANGVVALHEDKSHECEVGSRVYFTGVASPAGVNSTIAAAHAHTATAGGGGGGGSCTVHHDVSNTPPSSSPAASSLRLFEVTEVVSPYVLVLRGLADALGGHAADVGTSAYLHTTKKRATLHFRSLHDSIAAPTFMNVFDSVDKSDAPRLLHVLFCAVAQTLHRCPASASEVQQCVHAAAALYARLHASHDDDQQQQEHHSGSNAGAFDAALATQLLSIFAGELNPLTCFVGGMAAQEVLKVCSGKFCPVQQWMYYDAREVLRARDGDNSNDNNSSNSSNDDSSSSKGECVEERYARQVAVLGAPFQRFLSTQRAFIVGAGALGCEHVKNVALLGLGAVSITDMDTIEMSNLSRQFLFRTHHIGQPKATVAAAAAQHINGALHITAYEEKVDASTEGLFNEAFWLRHDVVLNALDNVQSRKYVDSRCLFYKRPLFESGTLGTKCNMQPVIPYVTESYSSSYDPPEKSIPLCTLKNFPNAIEHTIQWARDQFHLLFHNTPQDVNRCLDDRDAFAAELRRDPAAAGEVVRGVRQALSRWPRDDADCVRLARLLFQEYFCDNLRQLLHNLPLDKRNEDGQLFWSGAKKPPTPLLFCHDTSHGQDERHAAASAAAAATDVDFVYHAACLLAQVYGLPPLRLSRDEAAAIAAATTVPPFVARDVVIATDTNSNSSSSASAMTAATADGGIDALATLPLPPPPANNDDGNSTAAAAQRRMCVIEFEKDDTTNHHMDFITSASNLRARAYGIPPADVHHTRRIAGNITPAMVTTTALVTGLVGLEVLKYLLLQYNHRRVQQQRQQHGDNHNGHASAAAAYVPTPSEVEQQLSLYRSAFVNIALPFIAFSDPIIAEGKTYTLPSGATLRWGVWDRIDVDEGRDVTVDELVALLQRRYELEVFMLTLSSGKMVYTQFGGSAKDKAKPVSHVAVAKGEVLQDGNDYLDLVASGTLGDCDDVDIPVIRYKFRNFAA